MFDIPRNVMVPLDEVDVRLDASPHPFELRFAEEIAANWTLEIAANPALYNGRILLPSSLALNGRRLVGSCHAVNYETLLFWRKHRDIPTAEHAFASAALISSDGALVAIRMGPQTASAGRILFAAGSFEQPDLVDGRVDVDANMVREVREETGLDIVSLRRDPHYMLFSTHGGTAITRRYWLDQPADIVARKIEAFVAGEVDPEISGPVIIRQGETMPAQTLPHFTAFADWHFAR